MRTMIFLVSVVAGIACGAAAERAANADGKVTVGGVGSFGSADDLVFHYDVLVSDGHGRDLFAMRNGKLKIFSGVTVDDVVRAYLRFLKQYETETEHDLRKREECEQKLRLLKPATGKFMIDSAAGPVRN